MDSATTTGLHEIRNLATCLLDELGQAVRSAAKHALDYPGIISALGKASSKLGKNVKTECVD